MIITKNSYLCITNQRVVDMDAKIQPLVSFIITAYNIPVVMLRECVESITNLSLSVTEREIIIIDDGSDYGKIIELTHISPKVSSKIKGIEQLFLKKKSQSIRLTLPNI